MSQENVEIVRSAWNVFVTDGIEAVLPYFIEDCVLEDFPELPDHAVYHGKDGVRGIDRHFREMWGEFIQEPVEFIDAGDDLVVGVIAMQGRGKGSGAPMASEAFWVHEVRNGKLAHMRAFTTREQALEAAGISE
jgi:ketosteroid isomerase-like protein